MAAAIVQPLLETFQKHVEDMRNLVLCKICIKPLYEPYILGCGHSYCYTCLTNWFGGNGPNRKHDKRCPDCRAQVLLQPAPNYLLRDLVHMFISRAELLPEDEAVQDHEIAKLEENALMKKDETGEGLFGGAFRRGTHAHRILAAPIRDVEDGVVRCPECAWELEGGQCLRCGWGDMSEFSDEDLDSENEDEFEAMSGRSGLDSQFGDANSELDHELDEVDEDFDGRVDFDAPGRFSRHGSIGTLSEISRDAPVIDRHYTPASDYGTEYDEETPEPPHRRSPRYSPDEGDSEMEGFVVNDNEEESDSGTSRSGSSQRSSSTVSQAPIHTQTFHGIPVGSDSDDSHSDSESTHTATQGTQYDTTDHDDSDSNSGPESDDDLRNATPVPHHRPGQRRGGPIIDDDDDDDEDDDDHRDNFSGRATMSTTTTTYYDPPRSRADRTSHLHNQRNRRGSARRSPSVEMVAHAAQFRQQRGPGRPSRGSDNGSGRPVQMARRGRPIRAH